MLKFLIFEPFHLAVEGLGRNLIQTWFIFDLIGLKKT